MNLAQLRARATYHQALADWHRGRSRIALACTVAFLLAAALFLLRLTPVAIALSVIALGAMGWLALGRGKPTEPT